MSNSNYTPSSLTDVGLYMMWLGANHVKVTINQDPDHEWHVYVEQIGTYAVVKDHSDMMLSEALKQVCAFVMGRTAFILKGE